MKKIGIADGKWLPKSREEQIREQIARDDKEYWAEKEEVTVEYVNRPNNFKLTDTAKHVFGSTVHLFNSFIA